MKRLRTLVFGCLAASSVFALAGCGGAGGGGGGGTTLRGKVTTGGKPVVVGTVTAYRGSSKAMETSINPDGSYEFNDPSTGEYRLTVTKTDTPTPYGKPLKLPAKYAEPDQSGLTATVARGENTKDLSLDTK